ncbi:hypothetical protein B0H14DRAFT_2692724 [Mycena olivaceomarginata]|nr:hypothetical protein B0H14DRAFT_2692724 [Mycena olivaceomarginata]
MSEKGGTGPKSTGPRLHKASTQAKRPVPDSDYEEPTGSSSGHRKAADEPTLAAGGVQADRDSYTPGNVRNRDIHEGVGTVPHRVEKVASQVGSLGTRLPQVLAALTGGTAVVHQADLTQPVLQEITMFGGNGIGGDGGIGEGARILIDNFSGTQIIIRYSEVGGQVNPGIGRIGEGLATIRDGIIEVGGQIGRFMDDLLRRLGTQLMANIRRVPRGVSDDLFYVIDPVGGYISVPLQYCCDYRTLEDLLKIYLRHRPQAGAHYVERGDYGIVSEDGSFIIPMKFTQTVKSGMLLEMSILQRQVQNRSDTIQNTTCPSCGCSPKITTSNGWFKCTTCARNYRMDGEDKDLEEIVSPQLAQPNEGAEQESFRRVHILILVSFLVRRCLWATSDWSQLSLQQREVSCFLSTDPGVLSQPGHNPLCNRPR